MDAEQLWDTTMDPDARTLLQVNLDNAMEADKVFEQLMGDEVEPTSSIYRRKCSICEKLRYLRMCVTGGL